MAAGGQQDGGGQLEDLGRQVLGELDRVGDQERLVGAADQLGDGRAVQIGREQHRDGADPGRGAGEQGDVETVRLVDHHPAARSDPGGPQPGGVVVDQVGELGDGGPPAQLGGDVEVVVEDHHVRAVPDGGPLEERAQSDSPVGNALKEHRSALSWD